MSYLTCPVESSCNGHNSAGATTQKIRGEGVTTIYIPTGDVPFLGMHFFGQKIFFRVIFGKTTNGHKYWGVILEKQLFRVLNLIKFHILS